MTKKVVAAAKKSKSEQSTVAPAVVAAVEKKKKKLDKSKFHDIHHDDDDSSSSGSDSEIEQQQQSERKRFGPESNGSNKRSRTEKQDDDEATAMEVRQLHETELLFQSSLARMQFESLIAELTPKYAKLGALDEWLRSKLRPFLDNLKERKVSASLPIGDQSTVELAFARPSAVNIVGSYLLKTIAKPFLTLDVAVQIPNESFDKNDVLNGRYFAKRMLYLQTLAADLESQSFVSSVEFAPFCSSSTKPVIIVKPAGLSGLSSKFKIRILPSIAADALPAKRFIPERNNFRREGRSDIPSPLYNSSIVEDTMFHPLLLTLHSTLHGTQSLVDTVMLLKVWAHLRGLNSQPDGVNATILSLVLVHLVTERVISKHYSCLQALKAVFEWLGNPENFAKGIRLRGAQNEAAAVPADYLAAYDVVLMDAAGIHNFAFRVSKSALKEAQMEARRAAIKLGEDAAAAFDSLFINKTPFISRFDELLTVEAPLESAKEAESQGQPGVEPWTAWRHKLNTIAERAVGDRCTCVCVTQHVKSSSWPVQQGPFREEESVSFLVGANLNTEKAFRAVDRGPAANDIEAAESFRQFWGKKSELRRFADGAIVEAVVWDVPFSERSTIPARALRHAISHHLPAASISAPLSARLIRLLRSPDIASDDAAALDVAIPPAWRAFDTLSTKLAAMDGLPLRIESVHASHPVLRSTAVFPLPMIKKAKNNKNFTTAHPALDVILRLQKSSIASWPTDLIATRRLLSAFYIRIKSLLPQYEAVLSADHLDVVVDGYCFRLRIHSSVEWALLRDVSPAFGDAYDRVMRLAPLHHAAIAKLRAMFPAFSHTVRLALRWLGSHLLSNAFSAEAVETLVASLFLSSITATNKNNNADEAALIAAPNSELSGFRRFLELIAYFPFAQRCVVSTLGASEEDIEQKRALLKGERTEHPTRADVPLLLVTPLDPTGEQWTKKGPSAMHLRRAKTLAVQSLAILDSCLLTSRKTHRSLSDAFSPSHSEYDLLIHLNAEVAAGHRLPRQPGFLALYGFSPLKTLLDNLQERFGEFAAFFVDEAVPEVIAVAFRPAAFLPVTFKFAVTEHRIPLPPRTLPNGHTRTQLVPDVSAIVQEIEQLGSGVIQRVELLGGSRVAAPAK